LRRFDRLCSDSVEELGQGRCRPTLGSWSWPDLAAVGSFDAGIEVVGPTELTRRYANAATAAPAAPPSAR
jgi:hypothetical protein